MCDSICTFVRAEVYMLVCRYSQNVAMMETCNCFASILRGRPIGRSEHTDVCTFSHQFASTALLFCILRSAHCLNDRLFVSVVVMGDVGVKTDCYLFGVCAGFTISACLFE